jgi:hypothetical protein
MVLMMMMIMNILMMIGDGGDGDDYNHYDGVDDDGVDDDGVDDDHFVENNDIYIYIFILIYIPKLPSVTLLSVYFSHSLVLVSDEE